MGEMQEPVDEALFSLVVEVCVRIGRLDKLTEIMQKHEMHSTLPTQTATAHGSLIKAYGQARDLDRTWTRWREMRNRGVNPTAITGSCTVNALVKNDLIFSSSINPSLCVLVSSASSHFWSFFPNASECRFASLSWELSALLATSVLRASV